MAYSQYTSLKSVKTQLGLSIVTGQLFSNSKPIAPSDWLMQTLTMATSRKIAYFSEKSRSEALVFPVLLETSNRNKGSLTLYSGAIMDADKEKGLNGECDFILGLGKQNIELETPIFCIVEAKDNDIDLGIPQCIAQMFGANKMNESDNIQLKSMYGAVTTGETWTFLRLDKNNVVTIDEQSFYLAKVNELLGFLQSIINDCNLTE
jgi:hypothetical protein